MIAVLQIDYEPLNDDDRLDLVASFRSEPDIELLKRAIPHLYLAAILQTDSLDTAYRYTNSLDAHWGDEARGAGVLAAEYMSPRGTRCRSTSVSDIMVRDGKFYGVAAMGFMELPADLFPADIVAQLRATSTESK
jgi:hypothetical protein